MNKDNAADYFPFVRAMVDGCDIEFCIGKDQWVVAKELSFTEHASKYRIKAPMPWFRVGLYNHYGDNIAYIVTEPEDEHDFELQGTFIRWLTERIEYDPK